MYRLVPPVFHGVIITRFGKSSPIPSRHRSQRMSEAAKVRNGAKKRKVAIKATIASRDAQLA